MKHHSCHHDTQEYVIGFYVYTIRAIYIYYWTNQISNKYSIAIALSCHLFLVVTILNMKTSVKMEIDAF